MKTAAQKYNDNLDKLFTPQINKLVKYENVASTILTKLQKIVDIDPCGLDRCHLINAISRILQEQTEVK
jgi:hypothetical protein